jgi:hypothetical protein
MDFPSKDDFLKLFGIEPIEEDPSMAYCRYIKTAPDRGFEIDISFSAVSASFQVVLRCNNYEAAVISSERVKFIRLRSDGAGSGVCVVFDIHGVTSEALIQLEPELKCSWWTLRVA